MSESREGEGGGAAGGHGDTGILLRRGKSPSSIDGLLRQSRLRGHHLTRDQVAELRELSLFGAGRWDRDELEELTEELAR